MLKRLGAAVLVAVGAVLIGTGASAGVVTEVAIRDYAFSPQVLTIPAGTTITWTNFDSAPHTVTGSSGPVRLSSPELAKGQSWSFTFTLPGTYGYFCAVHPTMAASVVVTEVKAATPAPAPAPAAPSSRSSPVSGRVANAGVLGVAIGPTPSSPGAALAVAEPRSPVAAESSPARVALPFLLLGGLVLAVTAASTLALGARPR